MCLILFVFVSDVKLKNQSGFPRHIGVILDPINNIRGKYVYSPDEA